MKKKRVLPLILILALFITIGFAALRTNLQINGTANFKGNNWDIHFENVNITEGSATATTIPTSNNTTTTEITYEVNLNKPGDFYEFTVDVVNKGSINAMVETTPTLILSDTTLSNVLLSSITYEDGISIEQYDLLAANDSLTYKVRVEYKKNIQNSELLDIDRGVTITFVSPYVQADSNAKKVVKAKVWTPVTGNGSNVGDEIAIGDEHFYVISNDGTTINALAKYNLNVGDYANTNAPLGVQHESAKGWIEDEDGYGMVAFSNGQGWPNDNNNTINIQAYDGPVKSALNAYKNLLPDGIDVRLITRAELEGLGCSLSNGCSTPTWVYSTSYWSGSAVSVSDDIWEMHLYDNFVYSSDIWVIGTDGSFAYNHNNDNYYYGVRPVISFEI